jgi:hypothetical protein
VRAGIWAAALATGPNNRPDEKGIETHKAQADPAIQGTVRITAPMKRGLKHDPRRGRRGWGVACPNNRPDEKGIETFGSPSGPPGRSVECPNNRPDEKHLRAPRGCLRRSGLECPLSATPGRQGHGGRRPVRAHRRSEAHPECTREGEPRSQEAGLSSRPSQGQGVRTHVRVVNFDTPRNVAGGEGSSGRAEDSLSDGNW